MSLERDIASAGVWHDAGGLMGLRKAARDDADGALQEAARQFEAVFVAQVFGAMRATVPDDGPLASDEEQHWQGMLDRQLALDLTSGAGTGSGSGFGLADAIVRQLGDRGAATDPGARTPSADSSVITSAVFSANPSSATPSGTPSAHAAAGLPLRADGAAGAGAATLGSGRQERAEAAFALDRVGRGRVAAARDAGSVSAGAVPVSAAPSGAEPATVAPASAVHTGAAPAGPVPAGASAAASAAGPPTAGATQAGRSGADIRSTPAAPPRDAAATRNDRP